MPDNISLRHRPPYSPEPNPVAKIWQILGQNHLRNRGYDIRDAILDACRNAWNASIAEPARMTGIASRRWAPVNARRRSWRDLERRERCDSGSA